MLSCLPDKYLSLVVPVVVYWACAIPFDILDYFSPSSLEKYRIHESEEVKSKNRVSKTNVVMTVILQQIMQTLLGWWWLEDDANSKLDHTKSIQTIQSFLTQVVLRSLGSENAIRFVNSSGPPLASWLYWWGIPCLQIGWAM